MIKIVLLLGGNLGNVKNTLYACRILLDKKIGKINKSSKFYLSDSQGYKSENTYVNQAIILTTNYSPFEVLEKTQQIERSLGRLKKTENNQYHDRTIDIDILFYGTEKIDHPRLIIPHPRIEERAFVKKPLKEICPDYKKRFRG